jgi:retinol-binding protein 3
VEKRPRKVPSVSARIYVFLGLLLLSVYCPKNVTAQVRSVPFPLSSQGLKVLVDSLSNQISKFYIDRGASIRMCGNLKKRYREGRYNNIKDPHVLAGLLTNDVLAVHHDEHFHVEYNPMMANELEGNIEDVPRMVAEKLQLEKARNFGFKKAEILNGNIGYLEISSFSRLNKYSRATADAALQMLANTKALIIDLRYGVGGSPDMVSHLLSHFFKDRTHISDIYIRSENITLPYYTTPDSSYGPLTTIPLYVLTSYKTFSAAEGLVYALQTLKRATIVGEKTRGGAHTVNYRPVSSGFVCDIPFGKAVSPVTKKNWEKTGIMPDIRVSAEKALETAELKIFENAFAGTKDSSEMRMLKWQLDLLQSINHPFEADTTELAKCSGEFGPYLVSFQHGCLYYQKAGKAKFPLVPMSSSALRPRGTDNFIVEFHKDYLGKVNRISTHYDDGRIEYGERTK